MASRKILIVERESELRYLLIDLCRSQGIPTVVACDAVSAMRVLKRESVTEIITGDLSGQWKQIVKLARRQDSTKKVTLWTTDVQYKRAAEESGIRFVDQESFDLVGLLKNDQET